MFTRLLPCALAALFAFTACDEKDAKRKKSAETKQKSKPTMPDVSNDTSFQAFVGHLRVAVSKRDRAEITSLISPYLGYRWDQPVGQPVIPDEVFAYWDQTNSWSELERILGTRFLPHEDFMAAPPEFVADVDNYREYRVGIRLFNGSWKLAYFVTGSDPLQ